MEIYSNRKFYTDSSTISELFIDQNILMTCYILEPTARENPSGLMAIPEGRYEITLYDSPHFKMRVPILNGVPGHTYIEIHPGNFPGDTHDCLLPGLTMDTDFVGQSRDAFNILFPIIDKTLNTSGVYINIKNMGS